jgi:hypothetical protein
MGVCVCCCVLFLVQVVQKKFEPIKGRVWVKCKVKGLPILVQKLAKKESIPTHRQNFFWFFFVSLLCFYFYLHANYHSAWRYFYGKFTPTNKLRIRCFVLNRAFEMRRCWNHDQLTAKVPAQILCFHRQPLLND